MKKTYIEPKNTVVAINVRSNLMNQSQMSGGEQAPEPGGSGEAREVINVPDPWEEW